MIERPCDCAQRHMQFLERDRDTVAFELLHSPTRPLACRVVPVPAMHQHEDDWCSEYHLGIGGCPGLPHCRAWIIGAYRVGESLAEACGDTARAFELRMRREKWERDRPPMMMP